MFRANVAQSSGRPSIDGDDYPRLLAMARDPDGRERNRSHVENLTVQVANPAGGRYNRPKRRRISAPAEVLLRSLTKRLVNHARPSDVTEGYAADWTVEQLREPAQRIADRIDALTNAQASPGQAAAQIGPQPVRRSVSSRTVSRRRRPPRRCGHPGRRARAACPRPRKDSVRDRKSPPFAKERQWRAHVIILTLLALTSRSSEMYRREQFAVAAHCNRR